MGVVAIPAVRGHLFPYFIVDSFVIVDDDDDDMSYCSAPGKKEPCIIVVETGAQHVLNDSILYGTLSVT